MLVVLETNKSKTVKNKITIKGPKINPFIPNKLIPPKIEKKITSGWTFIRSFRNKGLKKLSKKLIQTPEIIKKRIPFRR